MRCELFGGPRRQRKIEPTKFRMPKLQRASAESRVGLDPVKEFVDPGGSASGLSAVLGRSAIACLTMGDRGVDGYPEKGMALLARCGLFYGMRQMVSASPGTGFIVVVYR